MTTIYPRIVSRWENASAAQAEAVAHGCILQHNARAPYQFLIAPSLLPDYVPLHTSHKQHAARQA